MIIKYKKQMMRIKMGRFNINHNFQKFPNLNYFQKKNILKEIHQQMKKLINLNLKSLLVSKIL